MMKRLFGNFVNFGVLVILLSLQVHEGSARRQEIYEPCDTNSDPSDKRNDFSNICEDICDGTCMQPVNYDPASEDKDDQLFCQCKSEACTEATPSEGDDAEKVKSMNSDCRQLCGNAGMSGYLLCEPSEGAAFSDSVCACNKKKLIFQQCNKKYERACASICNEQFTCAKTKKFGHYCLCDQSNPISNNEGDNNYECEQDDLGEDEKMMRKKGDKKLKKCIKNCEKEHEDAVPYFCTVTDKGKRTRLPKHVCACSEIGESRR